MFLEEVKRSQYSCLSLKLLPVCHGERKNEKKHRKDTLE